jgi:hypothetical protein
LGIKTVSNKMTLEKMIPFGIQHEKFAHNFIFCYQKGLETVPVCDLCCMCSDSIEWNKVHIPIQNPFHLALVDGVDRREAIQLRLFLCLKTAGKRPTVTSSRDWKFFMWKVATISCRRGSWEERCEHIWMLFNPNFAVNILPDRLILFTQNTYMKEQFSKHFHKPH